MKVVYLILAIVFYVLGAIGLVLPVIPQIPFLLLGTFFLAMSSEKFKNKIIGTKFYGKYIEPYLKRYPKISKKLHIESEEGDSDTQEDYSDIQDESAVGCGE